MRLIAFIITSSLLASAAFASRGPLAEPVQVKAGKWQHPSLSQMKKVAAQTMKLSNKKFSRGQQKCFADLFPGGGAAGTIYSSHVTGMFTGKFEGKDGVFFSVKTIQSSFLNETDPRAPVAFAKDTLFMPIANMDLKTLRTLFRPKKSPSSYK